jgi:hypothetical protein
MDSKCVCCGEYVPEGYGHICPICEAKVKKPYVKPEVLQFKIIAVDFDGTLCENKWPGIGKPNLKVIRYLIAQQKHHNAKVILWTCRCGDRLVEAIEWCSKYGLIFDGINENLPEAITAFGGDSRKIFAHEYIDDRASIKFQRFLPYIPKPKRKEKMQV